MLLTAIRRRIDLRDARGFTVLLALITLTVAMLLVGAAYVAVTSDSGLTRNDLNQQRAYAAAQAGISQYIYQLNQNPNYWNQCAGWTSPITGTVGSADAGTTETWSYRPLIATTAPANDQQCDIANPIGTMIEGGTSASPGTFRIASTGTSSNVSRTIVAQFRQPSFLNYVYYTDYETLDPAALYDPSQNPPEPTDCAVHYPNRGNDCSGPIEFITGDSINGPLHSEDTLAACGSPVFGRAGYNDALESQGISAEGQCSTPTPTINNACHCNNTRSPQLTPPATNSQILSIAQAAGYVYTGRTTIVLTNTTMTVTSPGTTNTAAHPTGTNVAWPGNGVIYVSTASSGCAVTYTPFTANAAYTGDTNCGNVYVSGNYTKSLTIASDNDIIVNGNITTSTTGALGTAPTGGQELGLVANEFVRVYHPISGTNPGNNGGCYASNNTGSMTDPYIYAAILAVNHSFIVDNYNCGAQLGTLTVWGAIAQLFRGPVGTSGGSGTGYFKSYNYDDRLASTEPPYFLSPASTAWYISRETECDGTSC